MKTILIGFDAFDPLVFEKLHDLGQTPNLSRLVDRGKYSRFTVANPPQSEVSWTSIATGLNPGGHGLFDFVHRNPQTYGLEVSLLPSIRGVLGTQFAPPHQATTIFDATVQAGFPATSLWWPATFPARLDSPVRTIPGLGTPDIFGQLGTGTLFTVDRVKNALELKTRTRRLEAKGTGVFSAEIIGPDGRGGKQTVQPLNLELVDGGARLQVDQTLLDLNIGEWSPIFALTFKIGLGINIKAVTRAILTQSGPQPILYFLPLQLHPLSSPWPYATPKNWIRSLWEHEAFLTLGWPQDTTGLEEGLISDEQFLDLCDQIFASRQRLFFSQLDSFREGLLAAVFDTLDRVQHMFWKSRPDIVEAWYLRLDKLAGLILEKSSDAGLLFVSDHGFKDFDYKVHLNRWLINQGYLVSKTSSESGQGQLSDVDWTKTKAYALGLNSLYLNLQGREGQGALRADQRAAFIEELTAKLLTWKGPDGNTVVEEVAKGSEALTGPLAEYGPDVLVGYRPPYRASAESGLAKWKAEPIEPNLDHWGADHCFHAGAVPGVLFATQGLDAFPQPSYADIPALAIHKQLDPSNKIPPAKLSDEDIETIEERLKGLGYL
jgi:predicted AlkP superfamily phosphohydrolase/phosphomutase